MCFNMFNCDPDASTVRGMDLITRQRMERRAAILTAARELIAERGYDALTVRDLAERCRVSVPTLYNQFGDKDGVLRAAIEEHFLEVLSSTPVAASNPGYDRLIHIIDQSAEQILMLSAYHQRLLEAFAAIRSTVPVQQSVANQLARAMQAELQAMREQNQLVDWANPTSIASQMTSASIAVAVVWSSGLVPDHQFIASTQYSTGLVLLGVAAGQTREHLEQRVRIAQQTLTTEPADRQTQIGS
jgi:AcrR family transcriptional regulator